MYTILNENLKVMGTLTLNNGRGSTAFFNDIINQQIATSNTDYTSNIGMNFNDQDSKGNVKLWNHTLTLSAENTDLIGSVNTRCYVMYLDEYEHKYYLLKIISISGDDNSAYRTIVATNVAIYEFGKKVIHTEKTLENASLTDVVNFVFKDLPFSIYISDTNAKRMDYQITADSTAQSILQDLQAKYDVDVNSWVNLDNSGNINERVIYFGPLGTDNGELIRYGGAKGFENINAEEVSDVVYTKIWINGVTSDTDSKMGHIGSVNNGLEYIVDDVANRLEYSIGASQQQPEYLEGVLTNTLLSEPQALLDWANDQIKIFNHPRFNYTVTPYHGQMVGLGDTIKVQDFHIKPMILVSSRVIQKTTSFASPETNTFVLGEFTNIFNQVNKSSDSEIITMKKDIIIAQESADDAKNTAGEAYDKATNAITLVDGKVTSYDVSRVEDLPKSAHVGDIAFVTNSDGKTMYIFTQNEDGTYAWVKNTDPDTQKEIADSVQQSIDQSKKYTDDAISTNNTSINNTIDQVSQEKVDLAIKDGDFNNKAQAMADKALADAKANTATVAQETLDSANQNIADAKKSLTDDLNKEISDRTKAVSDLDATAQGYADQAKTDAINAATTADGVINKKIDDTASSITTTINQNKSDADGKITTAQSTATQALNQVATKVSQTDYDKKTGQLQTDLTSTTQTANKATTDIVSIQQKDNTQDARMTQIESDASGVKTTVSDLQTTQGKQSGDISTLQQRADGFDATVTKVNNLSVGGRNLLLGTRDWTDNTRWNQRGTVTTDTYRGMVIASSGGAWSSPTYSMRYAGILQVGKTYTFSTYVRNTSDTDTKVAPYYEGGIVTPIGTTTSLPAHTDWFRVSITFQCVKDPTTSTANLRWEGQNGLTNGFIQFAGYKLEEGTIATDWTPAPEDLSSATAKAQLTADQATLSINNYKTDADGRISKAQADIVTNANAITQKVSQTDYDKKTGDLSTAVTKAQTTADGAVTTVGNYQTSNDARVKAAETKISQNANDITLRATTTDLNNAKADYNAQIAQVKVDAGKVETTVSNLSDTVNNISIGGRNLLLGTSVGAVGVGDASTNGNFNSGGGKWYLSGGKKLSDLYNQYGSTGYLTISFDWVASGSTISGTFNPQWNNTPWGGLNKSAISPSSSNSSGHYENSVALSTNGYSTGNATGVMFRQDNLQGNITITNLKLESGNQATDWTPAPEDTVNALASQQVTIDGITDTVSKQGTNIDSVTKRVTTAEGTLTTATDNISGLQTKQTITANQVTQEIADRKTGDNNTLQSSKDFTTSSITSAVNGVNSTITQTSDSLIAKIDTKTDSDTVLSLLKDNWSIGIADNVGAITSGIVGDTNSVSLINKHIILDSENTTVTGDFYALGGNFKNLNASELKSGTVSTDRLNVSTIFAQGINTTNATIGKTLTIGSGGTITTDLNGKIYDFTPNPYYYMVDNTSPWFQVDQSGSFTIDSNGTLSVVGTINAPVKQTSSGTNVYPYVTQKGSATQATANKLTTTTSIGLNGIRVDQSDANDASSTGGFFYGTGHGIFSGYDQANPRFVATADGNIFVDKIDIIGGMTWQQMAIPTAHATLVQSSAGNLAIGSSQAMWIQAGHGDVNVQANGVTVAHFSANGRLYLDQRKTGSGGSSLQMASDGAVFAASSATKYKANIKYDSTTSFADRLLSIDPATWNDKDDVEQVKKYNEEGIEPDHLINKDLDRYYGLIGEDLVKAGLDELVVRNLETGGVEGIAYDRIAIAFIPILRELRNRINEQTVEIERLKENMK